MRLALAIGIVILANLAHAQCPLPEIALHAVAEGETSYDRDYNREALRLIYLGAERDAARVSESRPVGIEAARLGQTGVPRLVAYRTLSLANRLRQLDCAVTSGREREVAMALYREIIQEAGDALAREGEASPPSVRPRAEWLPAPPEANRVDAASADAPGRRYRQLHAAGGVALGGGIGSLAAALAATLFAAEWQPCQDNVILCLRPDRTWFEATSALAALSYAASLTSFITSALLYSRAGHVERQIRLAPSLAVLPQGGSAGLRLTF